MSVFRPTELHEFLRQIGAKAKKSLSQNFLIDGNILRKIISASNIKKEDLVLEIGPGPGALSQMILKQGSTLLAVEKDTLFAEALARFQTPSNALEVVETDILQFPIEEELKKRLSKGTKAKVVANLPYHLTTPILARLLPLHAIISDLTLMVQEEVARRFIAKPGTRDYSSFTVFLNFYSHPSYAFFVGRKCFYPAPKVDSAVIQLKLHPTPDVESIDSFFEMTREAFKHRRKMLRASLKTIFPPSQITEALESVHLDPQARPEDLSLDNFLELFRTLRAKRTMDK